MKTVRVIVLMVLPTLMLISCAGTPLPPDVGLRSDGTIPDAAPPPDSPNCVSSYVDSAVDDVHGALPFSRSENSASEAQIDIRTILEGMARTEIVTDVPGYIHAVQYTALIRFPDDVEFWFPEDESVVHFRSAARLGYGDLGVNRRRMDAIRKAFLSR